MVFLIRVLFLLTTATHAVAAVVPSYGHEEQHRHIYLSVGLVWDKTTLHPGPRQALAAFREKFNAIKLTHFVSPDFVAAAGQSATPKTMLPFVQPGDSLGIYLSPGAASLTALGIQPRQTQSLWGQGDGLPAEEQLLAAYDPQDLEKLLLVSKQRLEEASGQPVLRVMTSDWTTTPALTQGMQRAGLSFNFSPIPPQFLRARLEAFPIYRVLAEQWGHITPTSRPFVTAAASGVFHIPQSAGSVDYQTSHDLVAVFKDQAGESVTAVRAQLFHTTVHFSTLLTTLGRLEQALQRIFEESEGHKVRIEPLPEDLATLMAALAIKEASLLSH